MKPVELDDLGLTLQRHSEAISKHIATLDPFAFEALVAFSVVRTESTHYVQSAANVGRPAAVVMALSTCLVQALDMLDQNEGVVELRERLLAVIEASAEALG